MSLSVALSRATETFASVDNAGDDDALELTAELLGTPRRTTPMYKGRRSGSHVQTPRAAPHKEKADHTPAESVEPASRITTYRRDRKARTARQPGARQGSEWPHQDRGTPTPTASNADRRERDAHPRDRRQQRAKGRSTGRQPTEELQVSADFLLGKVEDPRPTGEIIYELPTKLAQIHDLENGTGPMPVDEAAKEHIAIVEVDTAAGAGALVGYEHVIGHMKFAREWLRTQDLVAERCRLIRVIGESMEPTLCRRTAPARRVAARAAPMPPTRWRCDPAADRAAAAVASNPRCGSHGNVRRPYP